LKRKEEEEEEEEERGRGAWNPSSLVCCVFALDLQHPETEATSSSE
jgi:hypothetical protein